MTEDIEKIFQEIGNVAGAFPYHLVHPFSSFRSGSTTLSAFGFVGS
jgi:hypothetical protein